MSEFGVSVRRNKNNLYDEMLGVYNDIDDPNCVNNDDNIGENIVTDNNNSNSHRKNSTFFDIITEDFSNTDDDVNNISNESDNISNVSTVTQKRSMSFTSSQKRSNELDSDFQKPYDSSSEPTKRSRVREEGKFYNHGPKETMNLTKDMLPSLRVIGQLENSIILAMSGDVLVAIDQHAADERIKLENLKMYFPNDLNFMNTNDKFAQQNLKQVDIEMSIDQYTATQLNDFSDILLSWGFQFNIKSVNDENLNALHLTRVPVIEGDHLSIHDFLEFLHYLDTNSNLPTSACKPPAINRILNNKACKTAIKFGDKLSISQCKTLVTDLSTTRFPFQCAHNRPSIAPLLNLSPVFEEQHQNPKDIQYSSIMKRLYDL